MIDAKPIGMFPSDSAQSQVCVNLIYLVNLTGKKLKTEPMTIKKQGRLRYTLTLGPETQTISYPISKRQFVAKHWIQVSM